MTFPIVGAHFRPPAKALLGVLPSGCPLTLRPEPDNPYDPNAIAVWLASRDIPEEALPELDILAGPYGFTSEDIMTQAEWHLGYIPRQMAATVTLPPGDTPAAFQLSAAGGPMVKGPEQPTPRDSEVE